MDNAMRDALVQLLGKEMSDISEDCYCAGWTGGTEYFVPELCRRAMQSGQSQPWGHGEVTPEQARALTYLVEQVGSWAEYDIHSDRYIPCQPFPIPAEYIESIERERLNVLTPRRKPDE